VRVQDWVPACAGNEEVEEACVAPNLLGSGGQPPPGSPALPAFFVKLLDVMLVATIFTIFG
jgi:hypothetical protein